MKVNLPKPKIHNRFDIIVKDSKTGKVDEIKAYNTTLPQQVIDYLTREVSSLNNDFDGIGYIDIGRGVGTTSPTDIALFDQIARVSCSREEYQISREFSSATYKAILSESSYIGETITELGLTARLEYDSDNYAYYLLSHALLKDSEGNPISIGPKTDTQTIEIYATAYVEIPEPVGDINFIYNNQNRYNKGLLIGYEYGAFVDHYYFETYPDVGVQAVFHPAKKYKKTTHSMVGNVSTFVADRLLSTEGNEHDICEIELSGYGKIRFPNTSLFPAMSFTDENIGVGDGNNTGFDLLTNYWVEDTVNVKVDGVLQSEGSDYNLNKQTGIPLNYTGYISGVEYIPEAFKNSLDGNNFEVEIDGYVGYYTIPTDTIVYFDMKRNIIADKLELRTNDNLQIKVDISEDAINWTNIKAFEWVPETAPTYVNIPETSFRYLKIETALGSSGDYLHYVKIYKSSKQIEFTTPPGLLTGEAVGTGDGTTVAFDLDHTPLSIDTIYLDGVETTAYTSDGPTITFDTAPSTDVVITADYKWAAPITASWDTDVPPKSDKYSYDVELEVDWS